jgi:hypothetical protein
MVICPVAIAVGCKKCPIFKVCPVKGIIGDYKEPEAEPEKRASAKAKSSPAKSRSAKSRARRK